MKVIYNIAASGVFDEEQESEWRSLSDKERTERVASTKANIVEMAMRDMDCREVDVMIQIVEE